MIMERPFCRHVALHERGGGRTAEKRSIHEADISQGSGFGNVTTSYVSFPLKLDLITKAATFLVKTQQAKKKIKYRLCKYTLMRDKVART